jgi:hypothetical protein
MLALPDGKTVCHPGFSVLPGSIGEAFAAALRIGGVARRRARRNMRALLLPNADRDSFRVDHEAEPEGADGPELLGLVHRAPDHSYPCRLEGCAVLL